MLTPLNKISTMKSSPIGQTLLKYNHILDYIENSPEERILYYANDMVLKLTLLDL